MPKSSYKSGWFGVKPAQEISNRDYRDLKRLQLYHNAIEISGHLHIIG